MDETLAKLGDRYEPYRDQIDVEVWHIRDLAAPSTARYFETALANLRAVWYLRSRVEQLDAEYGRLADEARRTGAYNASFTPEVGGVRQLVPFFEVMEFEHLLSAAKVRPRARSWPASSVTPERSRNASASRAKSTTRSPRRSPAS
jgi:hypothetical protein